MISLTKEQIKETLERLRDYSYYLYVEKGNESLSKQVTKYKDHSFYLKVRPDGYIEAILENGVIGIYDAKITIAPPEQGIVNLEYQSMLINRDKIDDEYLGYFQELSIFICSYFQRAAAYLFLSRMHPETIDRITNDLFLAK